MGVPTEDHPHIGAGQNRREPVGVLEAQVVHRGDRRRNRRVVQDEERSPLAGLGQFLVEPCQLHVRQPTLVSPGCGAVEHDHPETVDVVDRVVWGLEITTAGVESE